MNKILTFLAGIFTGLLVAGLVYLAAGQPRGSAVVLPPIPTHAPIVVFISGEVANPGTYTLASESRAGDAVQAAGGFTSQADQEGTNLAAYLQDGQQLFIPSLDPGESSPSRSIGADLVNINTADLVELDSLPGIGPTTAQAIIDYRTRMGPFEEVDDLIFVDGIGEVTLEEIRELVTVG